MSGGSPVVLKPQQIVDMWDAGFKGLKAIHHQVGNYLVTVRDEDADLFCYGIALHYLPNPTNEMIWKNPPSERADRRQITLNNN